MAEETGRKYTVHFYAEGGRWEGSEDITVLPSDVILLAKEREAKLSLPSEEETYLFRKDEEKRFLGVSISRKTFVRISEEDLENLAEIKAREKNPGLDSLSFTVKASRSRA